MIKAESVSRYYGIDAHQVMAVKDLNLSIKSGERVSIIGRSGSGKSTLWKLLAGLDRPSEGTSLLIKAICTA
jgi:ABC-type lipoprotein export system ATPase subunit